MQKCQETAGLLFPTECAQAATHQCQNCQRWVCDRHFRAIELAMYCVRCVRDMAKDPSMRHQSSMAHLRDDPHFYWYYWGSEVFGDNYRAEDYAIFDRPADLLEPGLKLKHELRERNWDDS